MKYYFFILLCLCFSCATKVPKDVVVKMDYIEISAQFVEAISKNEDPTSLQKILQTAPSKELRAALNNDKKRKAFWVNVYNGHVQYLLSRDSALFDDRRSFFSKKRITVAGHYLSLEDIEHGIIRGNKAKLGLGLLPGFFPGKVIRQFKVNKVDYRIHFALNCGAKSCPKVAVYRYENLDQQFDASTKIFLNDTTTFTPASNGNKAKASVTSLFSWFRGDFGSKEKVLKKYGIIPPDVKPKFDYETYDWTLDLGHFIDLN